MDTHSERLMKAYWDRLKYETEGLESSRRLTEDQRHMIFETAWYFTENVSRYTFVADTYDDLVEMVMGVLDYEKKANK